MKRNTWLFPRIIRDPVMSLMGSWICAPFTYVVLSLFGMMVTVPSGGTSGGEKGKGEEKGEEDEGQKEKN